MAMTTDCPLPITPETPLFIDQAANIAAKVAGLSIEKIMIVMQVSQPLAEAVQGFYADWEASKPGKLALWTYRGDVYKGLQAGSLSNADADWAQQHLIIASGLYGTLRPFDGIQAYRLEMKTSLAIGRSKNLYDFWGSRLSESVAAQAYDWVCNCCSEEYSRPIVGGLKLPVITPVFFDTKPNGSIGTVPIYSKMMRGVFARWMIDNRITSPEQLTAFMAHGYSYDVSRSQPNFPGFSRAKMVPLRFE